jgi:D-sedoheptulose 7-phosphate isomerase
VEGLGKPGDVLIAFSTSGRSPNVLRALEAAGERGLRTIAFLGSGGPAASLAELSLCVDSTETARTQEAHQFLMHCFMDALEATLTSSGKAGLSGDHDA